MPTGTFTSNMENGVNNLVSISNGCHFYLFSTNSFGKSLNIILLLTANHSDCELVL